MRKTEEREVEIGLQDLRHATLAAIKALMASEHLAAMPRAQLPLVHAYLLGWIMRGENMNEASLAPLLDFIQLGYQDYAWCKQQQEQQP